MFKSCIIRRVRPCVFVGQARTLLSSAVDGTKVLTLQETRDRLKDIVGAQALWGSKTMTAVPPPPVATSQDHLPVRRMVDSYRRAVIPLGSNTSLREKYINYYNGMRFGRILEDLDAFAVAVCYTHTLDPRYVGQRSPLVIVTALVDRIDLCKENIRVDQDVMMTGQVTWAGKSSMEVTMDLKQEIDGTSKKLVMAKFLMVARNPATQSAAVINRLQPEGPEEAALFRLGEEAKAKRMAESQKTLLKTPPDEDERLIIHKLFLQTIDPNAHTFKVRVKPADSCWMEDTVLKNLVICMPEQRNLYNKIFGGFLMRKALELAFANATLHCKCHPYIEVVDDINFKKSVEVGSLLFLSSQIVYTEGSKMMLKVHAEVVNPKDESRETTNDFYFIFNTRGTSVSRVIPKSYAEAMLYLDGKRHFDK